jgi:hypothetical protein
MVNQFMKEKGYTFPVDTPLCLPPLIFDANTFPQLSFYLGAGYSF